MNKKYIVTNVTFVLLLIFVCLSFAPCIEVTTHQYAFVVGDSEKIESISGHNYTPVLCIMISLVEATLFFLFSHRGFRIAGLFLNLIKTIMPYPVFCFVDDLMNNCGGLGWHEQSLSIWGYLIIGVGILISVNYIIIFFMKDDEKKKVAEVCYETGTDS